MEKLSDLRNASVQDFAWLKNKIDSMPFLKPYLLDDVALYPGCSPEHTTIGFFRGEPGYVLFLLDKIIFLLFRFFIIIFNNRINIIIY